MTGKVNEATLEALVAGCETPQDVAALYQQMLQRVIDRGLSAELDAHLGYERHEKLLDWARSNTRLYAASMMKSRNGGTVERRGRSSLRRTLIACGRRCLRTRFVRSASGARRWSCRRSCRVPAIRATIRA